MTVHFSYVPTVIPQASVAIRLKIDYFRILYRLTLNSSVKQTVARMSIRFDGTVVKLRNI